MSSRKIQVLIAEDDPHLKALFRYVLDELAGDRFGIETVRNGREAVQRVLQGQVDVVLMDLRMPVMSGLEAITRIREFSNIPIVVISAYGDQRNRQAAVDAGATRFVVKPPDYVALCTTVYRLGVKQASLADGNERLKALHRRLQKLRERQARQGIETPPAVLTEIEDIEAEIGAIDDDQFTG